MAEHAQINDPTDRNVIFQSNAAKIGILSVQVKQRRAQFTHEKVQYQLSDTTLVL